MLDILAQAPRRAIHPDNHGHDEERRHQQQHALEAIFADLPALQSNRNAAAGQQRQTHTGPDVAGELATADSIQVNEYNADNQSGFNAFAERDEQG